MDSLRSLDNPNDLPHDFSHQPSEPPISVMYEPYRQCYACAHYRGFRPGEEARTCAAFPDQIPVEIWLDDHDHRERFPGDGGVTFEDYDPADPYDWGRFFHVSTGRRPLVVVQGHRHALACGEALDPDGIGERIERRRRLESGA